MILVVLLQAAEMCGVFPLTPHGQDRCACVVPLSPLYSSVCPLSPPLCGWLLTCGCVLWIGPSHALKVAPSHIVGFGATRSDQQVDCSCKTLHFQSTQNQPPGPSGHTLWKSCKMCPSYVSLHGTHTWKEAAFNVWEGISCWENPVTCGAMSCHSKCASLTISRHTTAYTWWKSRSPLELLLLIFFPWSINCYSVSASLLVIFICLFMYFLFAEKIIHVDLFFNFLKKVCLF